MRDTSDTGLERARQAKVQVAALLRGRPDLAGIGLTQVGTAWAVKVNLSTDDAGAASVPAQIDGVPVVVEVVGTVRRL